MTESLNLTENDQQMLFREYKIDMATEMLVRKLEDLRSYEDIVISTNLRYPILLKSKPNVRTTMSCYICYCDNNTLKSEKIKIDELVVSALDNEKSLSFGNNRIQLCNDVISKLRSLMKIT